jgi:hypothetical protein
MIATATFTKLKDGSWGLRVAGEVAAGDEVTVSKRDGSSETKSVGRVLWTGSGVALCTIADSGARRSGTMRYRGQSRGGAAAPVPGYSQWCTGRTSCGCFDCAS